MHAASQLRFCEFGNNDPLEQLPQTNQVAYLREYLRDLGVKSVVEEPNYFDRDYLAEFSAFYAISARGYPNICKRLHFFRASVGRAQLEAALGGDDDAVVLMQDSYAGFSVIRPIPSAPLGRTVLALYPNDDSARPPRIFDPARGYKAHIGGIELVVSGLAWQQQDTGVAACATIGVWTMLHSSAFDEHHAIPTTADITKAAHKSASLGNRIFPSVGLTIYQLSEAIKEHGLSPVVCQGDSKQDSKFSRERFASTCAAFIRSGYPVLILGRFGDGSGHAQCAVGFRDAPPLVDGQVSMADKAVDHLYIHDDNLGANVRFRICTDNMGRVFLKADPPPPRYCGERRQSPTVTYPELYPENLVVAVHNDLRTSPDCLHTAGTRMATLLSQILLHLGIAASACNLVFGSRFIALTDYCGDELGRTLDHDSGTLARVRLTLLEGCPPMSLHLGLVRISLADSTPFVDILFDTTDSDRNHPVFAHLSYSPLAAQVIEEILPTLRGNPQNEIPEFGVAVRAFAPPVA